MSKWTLRLGLLVLVMSGGLIAGCTPIGEAAASAPPTDAVPVVAEADPSVRSEGVVWPARSVTLQATAGGTVTDVSASEGDSVTAGSVLIQLDPTDAEMAVQQALAGLASANAQLDQAKAGTRPEQIAELQAQVAAASAAVSQAIAQRDSANAGLAQADILDAQAQVAGATANHDQAQQGHNDTMKCYDVPSPDGGTQQVCPSLGTYEEIARAQEQAAYANLLAAQAQLDAAQKAVAPQVDQANAGVASAVAGRDVAQGQLDLAAAGARPEEIAVAQAGVQQAEAALAQAQGRLEQSRIEVPFDAVVTDLQVKPGDTVAAGTPLATLGTLDHLQIKTTDLTELDVSQAVVGQLVVVTFDAQPDQPLSGTIARIDPQGTEQFGDVTYTAIIELDSTPTWARWGMKVKVEISPDAAAAPAPATKVQAAANPVPDPVMAEAKVVPEHSSVLQFVTGGTVSDAIVRVGDTVKAGDPLVTLDDSNQALAVAAAKAALATAQARLSLAQAGPRPEDVSIAEANLASAQAGLEQAIAARDAVNDGNAKAQLAAVQAQLDATIAQRRQVEAALQWAKDGGDTTKANNLQEQWAGLNATIAALQARMAAMPKAAAAQLSAANAAVNTAQAKVNAAQAALDLAKAGPTPESIEAAQADVQQAQADLAQAQVALDRTTLRAPFDGTVTQVAIEVGDTVGPGRPAVVLADMSHLQLTTTDLTELDVVSIHEGQSVNVTVDALPGDSWQGHVTAIKQQGQTSSNGDILYTVTINLDQNIPGLLWGMTTAVSFLND